MTKHEQVKLEIAREKQEDKSKAIEVLNETFSKWEFDSSTYNNAVIRGMLQHGRKVKLYIIVNNYLLEIKDGAKIYNYSINGESGKNTKNITYLDGLNFNNNSTIKILELYI